MLRNLPSRVLQRLKRSLQNDTLPYDFDEADYLAAHPDVAAAVEAGTLPSGAEHYRKLGRAEVRALRQPPLPVTGMGRDGLPLPSGDLMFLVTNGRDPEQFEAAGEADFRAIRTAVTEAGLALSHENLRVLDWGCGCGRLARHWQEEADQVVLHGCDINPDLVAWCDAHLPFGRFAVSPFSPPLDYATGSFDLIYGISVLTHLSFEDHYRWMLEIHRLLASGGIAVLTGHGPTMFPQLLASAAPTVAAGGQVRTTLIGQEAFICLENAAGSNASGNVLTEGMFAHIFAPFAVRLHRPRYGLMGIHDTYVITPRTARPVRFLDSWAGFLLTDRVSCHAFNVDLAGETHLAALIDADNLMLPAEIQITVRVVGEDAPLAVWPATLPARVKWTLLDRVYLPFALDDLPAHRGPARIELKVKTAHNLAGVTLRISKMALF